MVLFFEVQQVQGFQSVTRLFNYLLKSIKFQKNSSILLLFYLPPHAQPYHCRTRYDLAGVLLYFLQEISIKLCHCCLLCSPPSHLHLLLTLAYHATTPLLTQEKEKTRRRSWGRRGNSWRWRRRIRWTVRWRRTSKRIGSSSTKATSSRPFKKSNLLCDKNIRILVRNDGLSEESFWKFGE